jgi:indolepyruvate ferredoxin oxidoreductase beta subunit
MDEPVNVVLAGIGGQGVLKASDILADVAFRTGLDVKKTETHGMSQRGGSVDSDVRFGGRVWSPVIPAGSADYVVVLDLQEVEVVRPRLRAGGVLIHPGLVAPEALPNRRCLNVALLGVLSAHLDLAEVLWAESIQAALPARVHRLNEEAFQAGRKISMSMLTRR